LPNANEHANTDEHKYTNANADEHKYANPNTDRDTNALLFWTS